MRVSLSVVALVVCLIPAAAQANWSDNFDAYPPGNLAGFGAWQIWYSGGNDAVVTPNQALSAPHSVRIDPNTDVTNVMGGPYNAGHWLFRGWCYVPTAATGSQYCIFLNTYNPGDNWSAQILFDSSANVVEDDRTGAPGGGDPTLPLIRGRWVEVTLDIDLGTNIQTCTYNSVVLYTDTWTDHVSGGGALRIAVIDLFSNNASSVYWDNLELLDMSATPVEPSTWGQVKNTFIR